MDALLKIARLGYWRFEAGEVSDVMWALANARHWTPRLAEVEQGLLKAGGLTAYKPQEVAAILWGFATLGYTPLRLLYTARKDWGFRRSRGRSGQGGKSFGSIKDFQPGQLASLAWSLAVMKRVRDGQAGWQYIDLLQCHVLVVVLQYSERCCARQLLLVTADPHHSSSLVTVAVHAGPRGCNHASSCMPAADPLQPCRLHATVHLTCTVPHPPALQTSSAPFKTVWEEICRRGPAMTKHANVLVMVWQAAMAMRLEGGQEPAAAVPGDVTNKLLQVGCRQDT
jgi:hypothetical protein